MQSFRRSISILAALAITAVAAFVSGAAAARDLAVHSWRRTTAWFADRFAGLTRLLKAAQAPRLEAPRVALIGAAQFLGRILRRERPVVSPRWRMCPSV